MLNNRVQVQFLFVQLQIFLIYNYKKMVYSKEYLWYNRIMTTWEAKMKNYLPDKNKNYENRTYRQASHGKEHRLRTGRQRKGGRISLRQRVCRHMNLRPPAGTGPAVRLRARPCGTAGTSPHSGPVPPRCQTSQD